MEGNLINWVNGAQLVGQCAITKYEFQTKIAAAVFEKGLFTLENAVIIE